MQISVNSHEQGRFEEKIDLFGTTGTTLKAEAIDKKANKEHLDMRYS